MANGNKAYQVLTGEKFLRGALVRAFANGFFLLVGWGLVAIFAKKKIDPKKRFSLYFARSL